MKSSSLALVTASHILENIEKVNITLIKSDIVRDEEKMNKKEMKTVIEYLYI